MCARVKGVDVAQTREAFRRSSLVPIKTDAYMHILLFNLERRERAFDTSKQYVVNSHDSIVHVGLFMCCILGRRT